MSSPPVTLEHNLAAHNLVYEIADRFYRAGASAVAGLLDRGEIDPCTAELIEAHRSAAFMRERERILEQIAADFGPRPFG